MESLGGMGGVELIEIDETIPKTTTGSDVRPIARESSDSLFLACYRYGGDQSVVIRFDGVRDWGYGHPNDQGLTAHPLHGHGLEPYKFHRGPVGDWGERAWIGTFHDGTFTIFAESLDVLDTGFEGEPAVALDARAGEGTNKYLG